MSYLAQDLVPTLSQTSCLRGIVREAAEAKRGPNLILQMVSSSSVTICPSRTDLAYELQNSLGGLRAMPATRSIASVVTSGYFIGAAFSCRLPF